MKTYIAIIAGALMALAGPAMADSGSDVAVLALVCTPTVMGPLVEGEIKNLSSQPLDRLSITATFRDASGAFISVAENILATFRPVLPGQASPFRGYGHADNPMITKVTIVPSIMGGRALTFTGIRSADCNR
jgi:hypothetical protein